MGGDTFVPAIGGEDVEREHGDALRDAWVEEFDKLIGDRRYGRSSHSQRRTRRV